ncbi:prephenate dehydrogenase [Ascidiimonas sp. W6]|uniref:prephenate dehydrogenase n=1 Tax=Ascidiimonas meishanensis TaxID=3128903 RepID=UPI0030EB303E
MKIAIVGLGLIGGSFALSIKRAHKDAEIFGIDNTQENLLMALSLRLIDKEISYPELYNVNIVIVAVPVNVSIEILPKILQAVSDNTLVFDVGSSKELICHTLRSHPKRRNFLATHPIAGTEFSGPEAAKKDLFYGKTMIVCEVEKTVYKLQQMGLLLFENLGMNLRFMCPKIHDKHIAYVSHLSHISSFMLGKTVMEKEKIEKDIFDMAGSGFESTVRLAKSPANMWTQIFEQNRSNVAEVLEEYIYNLQAFKKLIDNGDFDKIHEQITETNRIREILANDKINPLILNGKLSNTKKTIV